MSNQILCSSTWNVCGHGLTAGSVVCWLRAGTMVWSDSLCCHSHTIMFQVHLSLEAAAGRRAFIFTSSPPQAEQHDTPTLTEAFKMEFQRVIYKGKLIFLSRLHLHPTLVAHVCFWLFEICFLSVSRVQLCKTKAQQPQRGRSPPAAHTTDRRTKLLSN